MIWEWESNTLKEQKRGILKCFAPFYTKLFNNIRNVTKLITLVILIGRKAKLYKYHERSMESCPKTPVLGPLSARSRWFNIEQQDEKIIVGKLM